MPQEVPIAFVGIAGLVFVISHLLARAGGWTELRTRYGASQEPPDGERFSWRCAAVGWVNYNNCIVIRLSEEGLYLAALWPLSMMGHGPILIPWSNVRLEKEGNILWKRYADLRIDNGVRLRLTGEAAGAVKKRLDRS